MFSSHSHPVHEQTEAQRQIFEPPEPGIRKVVVSTEIASTSLTIDGIVYVVDRCMCCGRYSTHHHVPQRIREAEGIQRTHWARCAAGPVS